jgi:hypothetical protein
MKLIMERCSAANDSMFLLPSLSVSPNAYCAPLVENKMRASANVIQPRSSGGNADKERARWPRLFRRASWHPAERERLLQIAFG